MDGCGLLSFSICFSSTADGPGYVCVSARLDRDPRADDLAWVWSHKLSLSSTMSSVYYVVMVVVITRLKKMPNDMTATSEIETWTAVMVRDK